MLTSLAIRDVVLIERLDLQFEPGLCVLTGETGAGKSILLDSLGLAMGARAEARLVRHGADQASVTAEFDVATDHPAAALLKEQGMSLNGEGLLLRRVLGKDGKSRAFVNDQPVSIGLLRQLGELIVEIHGQFDNQRLLNPASHKAILDTFGGYRKATDAAATAFATWRAKAREKAELANEIEIARRDEAYLRHSVAELEKLAPEPGEETRLAEKRAFMMHGEQLISAMNDALEQLRMNNGAEERLQKAARELERVAEKSENRLDSVIGTLDRAINETAEAVNQLERVSQSLDMDPNELENAEERLFALRALARKHHVQVDDLSELKDRLTRNLHAVEDGGARLAELEREEAEAKQSYVELATDLADKRQAAAARLDTAVSVELEALKLGRARFVSEQTILEESAWTATGMDRIAFLVATNPGTPAGPLNKIASGGEMARFMLALKVVLAESDTIGTLVFDEVDAGVGGAVAAAVGERLARLAQSNQILVVTHSPQVAARGQSHWRVAKSEVVAPAGTDAADSLRTATTVVALDMAERKEEIARMLAGAQVTEEARAAATSLLKGATA
jgi:DNA repair protein RecN (Recombination protein N)